ncbi:MAG: putative bifunctional diguanylate cyclase/phosphodiesterase [Acidimicrobiales bacterium]
MVELSNASPPSTGGGSSTTGEYLERLVAASYDALAVIDASGVVRYASAATAHLLGRAPAEIVGLSAAELIHGEDLDHALVALNHHRRRQSTPRIQARVRHADGAWVPFELTATNQLDDPLLQGIVVTAREAVAVAHGPEQTRAVGLMYTLLHHVHDGVIACDKAGSLTVINRVMADLLGLAEGNTPPVRWPLGAELEPIEGGGPLTGRALPLAVALRDEPCSGEYLLRVGGGPARQVQVSGQALRDGSGRVLGAMAVFRDVTASRAYERQLLHQATHDPLTGAANRTLLEKRLGGALRSGGEGRPALLFCDLDHFKEVNDALGHAQGDAVLVEVVDRLADACGPGDTLARLGGDEFVLLTTVTDERAALGRADGLLAALAAASKGEPSTSASIGVAVAAPGDTPKSLLRKADLALYEAKARGRGRCELYRSALGDEMQRRAATTKLLEQAMAADGLRVRYQAIVDLRSGRLVGAEALVRLPAEDGGLLEPSEFIDIAEQRGLLPALDRLVLAKAARAAARWLPRAGGREGPALNCNVSAALFASDGFDAFVVERLAESGLAPDRLYLELVEQSEIGELDRIAANMTALREIGVHVGLDDVGIGHASLNLISELPVSFLKIDRAFVAGMIQRRSDRAVVAAVLGLGRDLGLRVCAEGVEEPDQAAELLELGCQVAQGYLFARPTGADDLSERLGAR